MESSVIIAIASLSFAVVVNVIVVAYTYGGVCTKVKDMSKHLTDLAADVKEIGKKVARVEGILNGKGRS